MTRNRKLVWLATLVVIAGLFFALDGPINMATRVPFSGRIRQPAAWQGGLELMIVAIMVGSAIYFLKGWWRGLLLAVVILLYARRHGVDFAMLVSFVYFEGIISFGLLVLRRLNHREGESIEKYLLAIVLGTLTWGCIEWILSAAGFGSVRQLQIAAVVVLIGSLLFLRHLPLLTYLYSNLGERQASKALAGTFFCTTVLMLFAKSAVSMDYDSLWYAVRGDRVLVSGGSVFDPLGLVSVIHYYPKAYDLLLIPLNGLHSVTSIIGFSIWSWAAFGVCLYVIGQRLHWPRGLNLLAVSIVLATPAILNISITAKGDVMGAMWLFFGIWALLRYQASPDWRLLILIVSAAMVAMMFRPVIVLYAWLLVLIAIFLFAKEAIYGNSGGHETSRDVSAVWWWIVLMSCVWFVLVTGRTLLLAGVPFVAPDFLVRMAELLGLSVHYPIGITQLVRSGWQPDFLHVLYNTVFKPTRLPHILILWVGSAFVFLPLIGAVLWRHREYGVRHTLPLAILALTYPFILATTHGVVPGDDGNYFIIPVACAILFGMNLVGAACLRKDALGLSLRFVSCTFVVVFTAVALVTGDWGPGTRAWDMDFSRAAHDAHSRAMNALASAKMMEIYWYFRRFPVDTRVIGLVPNALVGNLPGAWLPIRYEPISDIADRRPGLVVSPEAIMEFMRKEQIQFVILPNGLPSESREYLIVRFDQALGDLLARGEVSLAEDDPHYTVWKLKDSFPRR